MRLLPYFVAIALLWGGSQSVYTALMNRSPTVITCADFLRARPDGDWFQLTGCTPDFDTAGFVGGSSPSEVFVPLRPADTAIPHRTRIVLVSKDRELLDYVKGRIDPAATRVPSYDKQDFEGLAKFGIQLRDKERSRVAKVVENVDEDFIMLEHGARPNLTIALVLLGLGLALSAYLLRQIKRGLAAPSGQEASPSPTAT